MNTKEFNSFLNQKLFEQTKKLIKENVEHNSLIDTVKEFQTLYGLVDKINEVKQIPNGFIININNVSEDELMSCCGGSTVEESHKMLLQGLHHDMEEKGLGDNMDLDLGVSDNNGVVSLDIKVTTNEGDMLGKEDVDESDSEDQKKIDNNLILGGDTSEDCQCNENKKIKNMKKKKIVRLTESEMVNFVHKLVVESKNINQPYTTTIGKTREASSESTPGLEMAKKSRTESGKENDENQKNVGKKLKDYLSFDGNDNPEFPKAIGKGEKVARKNTDDQDQEINDNRGRGPQDLNYDVEPGEKHDDKVKKALEGDTTMGNEDDEEGNTIKTETGEKLEKNIKIRQDIKKDEPLYKKEKVPVDTKQKLSEELEKMRNLYTYNKKTQ